MPTYVAADGTTLHYDEWGAGKTLVTLAGGAGRHPSYLGDLAGLPGRLVVPHLRDVGDSPAPAAPESGSYWHQANDVDDLRRHLGRDQLTIVAHSAGTRLAIAYAVRHPERVAGLLLISPPASYLVDVPSDAAEITAHRVGDPTYDQAVVAAAASLDFITQEEFAAWQRAVAPVGYARWTAVEKTHATVGEHRLTAARAFFSVPPPSDFADRVRAVTAPVRVITGAEDFLTGLAPVLALTALFPNGEAVVIDDAGHFPWLEQPAAFRQAAATWLNPA